MMMNEAIWRVSAWPAWLVGRRGWLNLGSLRITVDHDFGGQQISKDGLTVANNLYFQIIHSEDRNLLCIKWLRKRLCHQGILKTQGPNEGGYRASPFPWLLFPSRATISNIESQKREQ